MDKQQAESLVAELEKVVESNGLDHYTKGVQVVRKGKQKYLEAEFKVSIKIK